MRHRWQTAVIALLFGLCWQLSPARAQGGSLESDKPDKGGPETQAAGWIELPAQYRAARDFPYRTPGESMRSITDSVPLPTQPRIAASRTPYKLQLDTNGDGRSDVQSTGAYDVQTVTLSYADGTRQPYAMYLTHNEDAWSFRRHGFRVASYKGTQIVLIDDENDGDYDGYGADAIVVGQTIYGCPLSRMVAIKGELFELEVDAPGSKIRLRAWTGATGKVDVSSGFKAVGRVACALLKGSDGRLFDVVGRGGVAVPVGRYTLFWGAVASGNKHCRVRASLPVEVEADKTTTLAWGAPFRIDFRISRSGAEVTVQPSAVRVLGSAGEEYHAFAPSAFTPGVRIRNATTGRQVNAGTMTLG